MGKFIYTAPYRNIMAAGGSTIREVSSFKVKYSDVFHLRNLYVMMHEYLIDENWYGLNDMPRSTPSIAHGDIEKLYMERHHQKALHRGGKEYWIWWRLQKQPFIRSHGYYVFRLDVDFHGMYMQKLEIIHQGKKMNVDKGELEIFLRPKLVRTDLGKKFQKNFILRNFQELYENRILDQDIEKLEKELWREAYRFQGTIKAYLNLRNFIPVPEPFHPKLYGWEGQF